MSETRKVAVHPTSGSESYRPLPASRYEHRGLWRVEFERPKQPQQDQTLNLMRVAWKVATPEEREKCLELLAGFVEHDYESAARSLRDGMSEIFDLQRLKAPAMRGWGGPANRWMKEPEFDVAYRKAPPRASSHAAKAIEIEDIQARVAELERAAEAQQKH